MASAQGLAYVRERHFPDMTGAPAAAGKQASSPHDETTAWDDTQSSAAALSSRLVSAVGASMFDAPRASGQYAAGPTA